MGETDQSLNQTAKNDSPEKDAGPEQQDRWHTVNPGENLTVIAQAYYGAEHAAHWVTLYNFNRERIGESPDLLHPGMKLLIPDISEFL